MRFAPRCGWILPDPVEQLEHDERPRPQRLFGRAEIERLLWAYPPRDAADDKGAYSQLARTGCSRPPAALPTPTATSAGASRGRAHSLLAQHRRLGRRFASNLRHTFATHLIIDLGLDVARSAASSATRASRSRSAPTHISSSKPATHATSESAWPPAHSRAYSSTRQPRPAPRSSSRVGRTLRRAARRPAARRYASPKGGDDHSPAARLGCCS
jgi:hypothetical protein